MNTHKFRLAILLALAVLIPGQGDIYAAKKPRYQEVIDYYSADWATDSKHIIYIKNIIYSKLRYDWLAEITKSTDMTTGRDYCVCKMNIETGKEEIIRRFRKKEWFTQKGWKCRWEDKKDIEVFGSDVRGAYNDVGWSISELNVSRTNGDILLVVSSELYVMNSDGANLRKAHGVNGYIYNARWSPDGKKILYSKEARNLKTGYWKLLMELWLIDVDGTNDHILVKNASHGIWHPSGKKIYFHSEEKYDENMKYGTYELNLTDKSIKYFIKSYFPSDCSNDGRMLLAGYLYDTNNGDKIYTKNIPSEDPRISPDCTKLLGKPIFVSNNKGKKLSGDICIVNIDGTNPAVLLKNYSKKY